VFATLTAFPPGVLMTRTPRRVASCKSMLSTPDAGAARAKSGSFRKEVWRDARGAADDEASASASSAPICVFVVTTTFRPGVFLERSTPRSLILSAT